LTAGCASYALRLPAGPLPAPALVENPNLSFMVASWTHRLGTSVWWLAALFAAAISIQRVRRLAAAGLVVVLGVTPLLTQADTFDCGVMALIAAWLVLLPIDAEQERSAEPCVRPRIKNNLTVDLLVANLALVYMNVWLWRRHFPQWDAHAWLALLVSALVALWLLNPAGRARVATVALQLAFHISLAIVWGHVLGNTLLMATAPLSLARAPRTGRRTRVAGITIDGYTITALALTCTTWLFVAGQLTGIFTIAQTAGVVLQDLGLLIELYRLG
jgi:hypothetical protein